LADDFFQPVFAYPLYLQGDI